VSARPPFGRHTTARDVVAGLDLRDRVVVVTGADSGMGRASAEAVASAGAQVVLCSPNAALAEAAADRMRGSIDCSRLHPVGFDLGELSEVRAAADALPFERIDALVCNAGVYGGPYTETSGGMERTFSVCYLGHAELCHALLPRLRTAKRGRVVLVSSWNHRSPRTMDVEALPVRRETYSEWRAYGYAKRCLVMFAFALARREPGLLVNALHPGNLIRTSLGGASWQLDLTLKLASPLSRTPASAAATQTWLAIADGAETSGSYFVNGVENEPARGCRDVDAGERLWERTLEWLGRQEPGVASGEVSTGAFRGRGHRIQQARAPVS
jgi:WW domain-containing oxidoreductase